MADHERPTPRPRLTIGDGFRFTFGVALALPLAAVVASIVYLLALHVLSLIVPDRVSSPLDPPVVEGRPR